MVTTGVIGGMTAVDDLILSDLAAPLIRWAIRVTGGQRLREVWRERDGNDPLPQTGGRCVTRSRNVAIRVWRLKVGGTSRFRAEFVHEVGLCREHLLADHSTG